MRRLRIRCAISYDGSFKLPVDFIYDSFFLMHENYATFPNTAKTMIKDRVNDMKAYLIPLFKDLMTKQIKKYLGRPDRLKPGAEPKIQEIYKAQDLNQYPDVFNIYTLRSSSHIDENGERIPNLRWGQIAKKILEIQHETDPGELLKLMAYQGGLFNLVHNTKTPVIDKFANGYELVRALDKCANEPNPDKFLPNTSLVVRDALEIKKGSKESGDTSLPSTPNVYKKGPSYKYSPGYYGD